MITGRLNFHSETGTEGGYYTVQDSNYISHIAPDFGVFRGETIFDPNDLMRTGKVIESWRQDGTPFQSAQKGDIAFLDIDWDDKEHDIAVPSCNVRVERWSYDGLTYLNDGDRLTIFTRGVGSAALWCGVVELLEQDPYGNDSYTPFGLACHHKPLNTKPVTNDQWSQWFLEGRFATLERDA